MDDKRKVNLWSANLLDTYSKPGTRNTGRSEPGFYSGTITVPTFGENGCKHIPVATWRMDPQSSFRLRPPKLEKWWVVVLQFFHLKSFIFPLAYEKGSCKQKRRHLAHLIGGTHILIAGCSVSPAREQSIRFVSFCW